MPLKTGRAPAECWPMSSLNGDLGAVAGMLALLVFLLLSTLWINHNRKARTRMRKLTERLLNWK